MASKSKITPLFDNVLIRPLQAETKTAGGIILPDSAKEKPQIGEVMAVGSGHVGPKGEVRPMTVKKGQKVMYKKWGGNEVKVENEEWMIVKEDEILAIVE
ncbi:MAG TPA: co-chaperone GroES [Patescibacteria group bacterium]|nr:co-chaperone GroES [Patescibacteria group bacterium]